MPQPGSLLGDVFETVKEQGKKIVKEVASAPVDIVKASFEQPIPNPTAERQHQIKAESDSKLAAVRSNLRAEVDAMKPKAEQPRIQQGAETAERGQTNQMGQMNNQGGAQLSANMTPKKKPEPLVVQQKRNNKLHGAG